MNNDITIHYVAVREFDYKYRESDDEDMQAYVVVNGHDIWLDETMYIDDDYFDGAIGDTYFSGYYIKYLGDDLIAIAYVTW